MLQIWIVYPCDGRPMLIKLGWGEAIFIVVTSDTALAEMNRFPLLKAGKFFPAIP